MKSRGAKDFLKGFAKGIVKGVDEKVLLAGQKVIKILQYVKIWLEDL